MVKERDESSASRRRTLYRVSVHRLLREGPNIISRAPRHVILGFVVIIVVAWGVAPMAVETVTEVIKKSDQADVWHFA